MQFDKDKWAQIRRARKLAREKEQRKKNPHRRRMMFKCYDTSKFKPLSKTCDNMIKDRFDQWPDIRYMQWQRNEESIRIYIEFTTSHRVNAVKNYLSHADYIDNKNYDNTNVKQSLALYWVSQGDKLQGGTTGKPAKMGKPFNI